jgi:hypothetical protein
MPDSCSWTSLDSVLVHAQLVQAMQCVPCCWRSHLFLMPPAPPP